MSTTSNALPVAGSRAVRRYVRDLARRHPRMLWGALSLHVLAALSGLAAGAIITFVGQMTSPTSKPQGRSIEL